MRAGQIFSHQFDHTNSDSDCVNSDGINSDIDDANYAGEEGKLESIFSNKMLSVRVTSANRQKEVKQTSITLNLSKERLGANLETIKENVGGPNTLRRPENQRNGKPGFIQHMTEMSSAKKDKIVLPTQFNLPSKFYSPHGDSHKQNQSLRRVPKQQLHTAVVNLQ